MSKVFFRIAVTLDGFMAGPNGGPTNPLGDGGLEIHNWFFPLRAFKSHMGQTGGQTGASNHVMEESLERAGAFVMGKRMFEEGEANWPEHAPFGAPVFVVTHTPRQPWVRKNHTTFYFVTDGIKSAIMQAKKAAGNKDVQISGGASMVQQCLNHGWIDDFIVHQTPLVLGNGVRLFDNLEKGLQVEITAIIHTPEVTHVKYNVKK